MMKTTLNKYFFVVLLLIGCISNNSFAQNPVDKYKEAIEYYKTEKFSDATVLLQELYDEGYVNFEICYNLGNCYFRGKDMASAILYYERALKFDPYNENVLHNLDVADYYIVDKIEVIPEMFITRFWNNFISLMKPFVWSIIFIGSLILFLIFIFIVFFSNKTRLRKTSFVVSMVSLFVLLFTLFVNISIKRHFENKSEAIVFNHSVSVKGSPSEQGVDLFVIHKGTKVKITDKVGDWIEINLTNGKVGWMKKEGIVVI